MAEKFSVEIIPETTASSVKAISGLFSAAFGGMEKRLAGAGAKGLGAMAGAAGGVASAATAVASGPLAAVNAISGMADVFAKFVNAFNPAIMEQFTQAMNDAFAIVGQSLVPVFQILTPLMRMAGDFIASIIPSQEQMNEYLKMFQPLMELLGSTLATMAPIIKMINDFIMSLMIPALEFLVQAIQTFVKTVASVAFELLQAIDDIAGVLVSDELLENLKKLAEGQAVGFNKTARGAAAGGAQFSSIGDLNKSAIIGAFGMGAPMGPQEKLVNINEKQLKVLENIAKGIQGAVQGGVLPQGG